MNPARRLDPIATAKIERLVVELKRDYTVIIVTHNMQQASRVSENTAFMYLGSLIEYGKTKDIFESPKNELNREVYNRRIQLRGKQYEQNN